MTARSRRPAGSTLLRPPTAPDRLHQLRAVSECRVLVSAPHVRDLGLGEDALGDDDVVDSLPGLDPHRERGSPPWTTRATPSFPISTSPRASM